MTGSEKILERILKEAQAEAEGILATAQQQADDIVAQAKTTAAQELATKNQAADRKAEAARAGAVSSAELAVRNAVLRQKRAEIDATLQALLASVETMPAKAYFDLLQELVQKYARAQSGVLFLGPADLERCPADFAAVLAKKDIALSPQALPAVRSGFVLKYGDIELNCTFASLVEEKAEQLEDHINMALFA